MDPKAHWQKTYRATTATAVSWYRPHLDHSLALVERVAKAGPAAIIDVGGGASTLVDDLISRGYRNLTVLDIAPAAIALAQRRLGAAAERVAWLTADITEAPLPPAAFDVWHDRAVFHFLIEPEQRAAYVRQAAAALKPGGHLIVGAFGPDGPTRCSGLNAIRYDAASLGREFAPRFRLRESATETHQTPAGKPQPFLYCLFALE